MEGTAGPQRASPVVFNTGMVLHGLIDLMEYGIGGYEDGARRAAEWLTDGVGDDGVWTAGLEYQGIPHAYNARVSWAMLRWAAHSGDVRVESAARRQLDWVVGCQQSNGWFTNCVFKNGQAPSTHGIAYTLRGLSESYQILGDERYLVPVVVSAEALMHVQDRLEVLPAVYGPNWEPLARHVCLTGLAQLGHMWLRLYELTSDSRYLNAGLKTIDQASAHQEGSSYREITGALAGSFPVWGRYAPLQYPNWATKFLADALAARNDVLADWR